MRGQALVFLIFVFFGSGACWPNDGILPSWMRRNDGFENPRNVGESRAKNEEQNSSGDGKCRGSKIENWTNCYGSVKQPNGTYEGYFKNGKYNGKGTFLANNGASYRGEYYEGSPHGRGVMVLENGTNYTGEFKNGKFSGDGILLSSNGDRYEGQFEDGQLSGFGKYFFKNGDIYIGEQKNNKRNGKGKYIFADGRPAMVGDFENDKIVKLDRYENADGSQITSPIARNSDKRPVSETGNSSQNEQRRKLNLEIAHTQPDVEGEFRIDIKTNSDTASLKINGEEIGGRADGTYSIKRVARAGQETQITIVAKDVNGNTESKSIVVARAVIDSSPKYTKLDPTKVKARASTDAVAIIIGIQNYKRLPKSEYSNEDARSFYDYAIRALKVKPENIKLLVDEQADEVEILSAFQNWLPLKVKKEKTEVYVFYSGHGLPSDDGKNLYVLPYGADRQFIAKTALNQQELVTALQALQAKSVTMFIDACYSGQIRTGESLVANARPIAIKASSSIFPPGFTVLAASSPDQLASSSPELGHGIFSYFLMKGMEGDADENKNGEITLGEIQTYVDEMVKKHAMSLNRRQEPSFIGDPSRVLIQK